MKKSTLFNIVMSSILCSGIMTNAVAEPAIAEDVAEINQKITINGLPNVTWRVSGSTNMQITNMSDGLILQMFASNPSGSLSMTIGSANFSCSPSNEINLNVVIQGNNIVLQPIVPNTFTMDGSFTGIDDENIRAQCQALAGTYKVSTQGDANTGYTLQITKQ